MNKLIKTEDSLTESIISPPLTEQCAWRSAITSEWNMRREAEKMNQSVLFPLAMNPFGEEEIIAMVDVLLSGRLTLASEVQKAERRFAEILSVPYAVMVNSGSSANLLAVSAISNKLRHIHCKPGDQVLIPAVCWSTSVFPLIQNGLQPVFVDVDPNTFNVTLKELESKITPRVRAVMAVHVLGNSINMKDLMTFVKKYSLILIEDTCESLGSYFTSGPDDKKMLGTSGDFGTFSFYFSHHITSGEGGMVVCHNEDDYNLVRCLRAHGWTRHLTNREDVESVHTEIDSRFLFVNLGYNLRPLEVQAAMLNVQLEKLHQFNECRRDNLRRIKETMLQNKILNFMSLMEASEGIDPAWFGLALLLYRAYAHQRSEFLTYLTNNGIENRPIISGNFTRQPSIDLFCDKNDPTDYVGADTIHWRGFFIGIHQIPLDSHLIQQLIDIISKFPFKPYHTVIVTGGNTVMGKYIRDVINEQCPSAVMEQRNDEQMSIKIKTDDAEWIFLTALDGDLRKQQDVKNIFRHFQPTHVLHCLAFSENKQDSFSQPLEQSLSNFIVTVNLLEAIREFQSWIGKIKCVCLLRRTDSHEHIPADYYMKQPELDASKYIPHIQTGHLSLFRVIEWYREHCQCDCFSISTGSIFGAYFDISRVENNSVNSTILRMINHVKNNLKDPFTLSVPVRSLRDSVFAYDLARIATWACMNYNGCNSISVIPNIGSTHEVIQIIAEILNIPVTLGDDSGVDEIVNRKIEHTKLTLNINEVYPEFIYTKLVQSIRSIVDWLQVECMKKPSLEN